MGYRQKEACIVLFDATLSDQTHSELFPSLTKFELGRKVADNYLRRFLQENRKTDQVGIVVLGAGDEESDEARTVIPLQSSSVEHRKVLDDLTPATDSESADLAEGVRLAADEIIERTGSYKFQRTIAIVTDGASVKSKSSLESVIQGFRESSEATKIEVLCIDYGIKTLPKSVLQGQESLCEVVGKDLVTAITPDSAFRPRKRHVNQVKKWEGEMEVSPYCKFHVIMVARIAEEKLKSLEKRSKRAIEEVAQTGGEDAIEEFLQSDNTAKVSYSRSYYSAEDPDREVGPEDRSKGFRYGRDIVPSFPGDEEAMHLSDDGRKKCLKVIGIIDKSELLRNYMINATSCVVGNPGAEQSQQGFSAFVRALRDLDKVATCRYVWRDGTNPKFIALIPGYLPEDTPSAAGDCLWHVQMPTMEDMRDYPFESLDKYKPTDLERKVASAYVRAMTLKEGDAKQSCGFDPEHTFNPVIARYWEALHAKALQPDEPIPAASTFVTAMICPDPEVVARTEKSLNKFAHVLPLKRVVRRRDRGQGVLGDGALQSDGQQATANEVPDVYDGGETKDEDDWFSGERKSIVDFVGTTSPVEDMWAILEQSLAGGRDRTADAFRGIASVIRDFVGPDGDRIYFQKALQSLVAFRQGALKFHGERAFNEFMSDLKQGLLAKNSDQEFWQMVRDAKVTLITSEESNDVENISQDDADTFLTQQELSATTQKSLMSTLSQAKAIEDDVFDEMD